MSNANYHPETLAIHRGQLDDQYGSISVPIYQTSTYQQDWPGEDKGYCYTRTGNPTRDALQDALAALEGGERAFVFATGIAAENALLQALLRPGDVVVVPNDLYGGTYRLLFNIFARWDIQVRRADYTDLEDVRANALGAKLIWIESPTNPRLEVYDVERLILIAKAHHALSIVDNTFATPLGQQPLALGADVVVHSVTKYLSGHSDVVLGALIVKDAELADRIAFIQNGCGGGAAPFECWLALRGIRTFPLRFRQHCANAVKVATWLEKQVGVARIYYPLLESHETFETARRCLSFGGGVVSLELEGNTDVARRFASSLKLFKLAESLGGVTSLVNHPASMTHASVPKEEREKIGLSDSLIRLSVGLEDADDLIADLKACLEAV